MMANQDQSRRSMKKTSESKLGKEQKILLPTPPKTSKSDSLNSPHRPKPPTLGSNDLR
jgi:hypothetical protein